MSEKPAEHVKARGSREEEGSDESDVESFLGKIDVAIAAPSAEASTSKSAKEGEKKNRDPGRSKVRQRIMRRENGDDKDTPKRKRESTATPESVEKNVKKKVDQRVSPTAPDINGNNQPTPLEQSQTLQVGEETMETDQTPMSYADVAGEVRMVVLPENYPYAILSRENFEDLIDTVTVHMDNLPPNALRPNFVYFNYVNGFAQYCCSAAHSVEFLKAAVAGFDCGMALKVIPQAELPKPPVFKTFTPEKRNFTAEKFLERIPLQNQGCGIDTSSWKLFNVTTNEHGTSMYVEMDAPSASVLVRNGSWLFYWLSTIKFTDVKTKEAPAKLTTEQLRAIGNANVAAAQFSDRTGGLNGNENQGSAETDSAARSNAGGSADTSAATITNNIGSADSSAAASHQNKNSS